jgi:hypothetical protein
MNLSRVNVLSLTLTFDEWDLPYDLRTPIYNYLVHGLHPGSFYHAVFVNNFLNAVSHSHPLTVQKYKNIAGWIVSYMPPAAFGNYEKVEKWLKLDDVERREILEDHGLIYTPQQETWLILKDSNT